MIPAAQASPTALAEALVDQARDALIAVSTSGQVLAWNRGAQRLFGHESAAAVGQSLASVIAAPAQQDEIRRRQTEAFEAGSATFSCGLERPGGASIPVELTMTTVRDAEGSALVTVDARDVSDVEQLREGRASDAYFKDLIEAAPDAKVIVGEGGLILLVNAQTERVFGYTREELVGQSMEILVPERFRGIHPVHRAGYLNDPRTRRMGERRERHARRKDGTEFPAEISLSPLRLARGTLVTAAMPPSSGCTSWVSFPGPGSASRPRSASSTVTADGSGPKAWWTAAPRSISPCQSKRRA